ncbi:MAG: 23S rRNA (adenine(2503)-C(2))-methyltransferase RlmN [Desulfovibrio sp.]|nr:23S rRNA (adenine(2503)-C(2))-methyltransferase RlmN [Desulfovibrio sp.]
MINSKINLVNHTLPELESWFTDELKEPRFRAVQIWQWIWQKLARDFDCMTNVSKSLRAKLGEIAEIRWPKVAASERALDGTTKFLLEFEDGLKAETVLIPAENRAGEIRWTQCLSTQIGCPMACSFCATGQMGLKRNLTMGEILGQVLIGRDYLNDRRPDWPVLRNLVFMGMGEPLLNLGSLMPALRCLHDEAGLNFSPRRITVSTCGLEKGLEELGESGLAYLAVSLHAPTQELRSQIMPKASRWPLRDMIATLGSYPLKARERITFEYLLLGGVNDSPAHAAELVRLIQPLKAKLNLIVYNPVPGLPYKTPTPEAVEAFQRVLWQTNITAILRKSRGASIAAACGQLAARDTIVTQNQDKK